MAHVSLVSIVVDDYDRAIAHYVDDLGFELIEDSPAPQDGQPDKRWVVVRPVSAGESAVGLLLARATNDQQRAAIGDQHGGRVGFFLRVDDFAAVESRFVERGVEFVRPPRDEPYGRVAVFRDAFGNLWDLLGPPPA